MMEFSKKQLKVLEDALDYYEAKNRESFLDSGVQNDDGVITYDLQQKHLDDLRRKVRKEA